MSRIKSKISQAPADPADSKYKGHLFVRSIPETTKTSYKSACAVRNRTMRDVLVFLMREFSRAVREGKDRIYIDRLPKGDSQE